MLLDKFFFLQKKTLNNYNCEARSSTRVVSRSPAKPTSALLADSNRRSSLSIFAYSITW